jgi:HTH-type transcriptional regulator/antitoxin HipB
MKRGNTMKKSKNLKTFSEHLDEQYGKTGKKKRDEFDRGFEAFKLGVLIKEVSNYNPH